MTCTDCAGDGWYITPSPANPDEPIQVQCAACNGTGDRIAPGFRVESKQYPRCELCGGDNVAPATSLCPDCRAYADMWDAEVGMGEIHD